MVFCTHQQSTGNVMKWTTKNMPAAKTAASLLFQPSSFLSNETISKRWDWKLAGRKEEGQRIINKEEEPNWGEDIIDHRQMSLHCNPTWIQTQQNRRQCRLWGGRSEWKEPMVWWLLYMDRRDAEILPSFDTGHGGFQEKRGIRKLFC